MSFEYHFTPASGGTFSDEFLSDARSWLDQRCTLRLSCTAQPRGTLARESTDCFLVFRNRDSRDRYRPPPPGRNDYLTPAICLTRTALVLSSTVDDETDEILFEFVRWADARVEGQLWYGAQAAMPEDLLERA